MRNVQPWQTFLVSIAGTMLVVAAAAASVSRKGDHAHATRFANELANDGTLARDSVSIADSAVGTFLGIEDELLITRMQTQAVAHARLNKGGTSISFRLDFADGSRAAFKPTQTNPQTVPRKEVAAYRLARLLELHAVAPATVRKLHRNDLVGKLPDDALFEAKRIDLETIFDADGMTIGELSFWIPTIVESFLDSPKYDAQWSEWLKVGTPIPKEREQMMAQLSTLLVFDMLTNNSDRFSGGNLKMSPEGQTLYFMDNTFGFQIEPNGHQKCRQALQKTQKFSRRFVTGLRSLTLEGLTEALRAESLRGEQPVLTVPEMESVMSRRTLSLAYIDGLIGHFGESQILVFP